jgi:hypothetical protein
MAFIDYGRWAALNKDKAEEMAAKTLQQSQGVFNRANHAIASTAGGNEADTSSISEAEAKRKALQSLGGIAGEQKKAIGTSNAFDAALTQGSQTMGNAYAQMGDYQKALQGAQQQGQAVRDRRDELARKHALAQVQASDAQWQQQRDADLLAEGRRQKEDYWRKGQSGGDYAGYSDYREAERQKSRPTRQKSIWDFFGR